jgi:hypothetical protein
VLLGEHDRFTGTPADGPAGKSRTQRLPGPRLPGPRG